MPPGAYPPTSVRLWGEMRVPSTHLGEVVWGDAGRDPDRDPARPVDQQQRNLGGEDRGLVLQQRRGMGGKGRACTTWDA